MHLLAVITTLRSCTSVYASGSALIVLRDLTEMKYSGLSSGCILVL